MSNIDLFEKIEFGQKFEYASFEDKEEIIHANQQQRFSFSTIEYRNDSVAEYNNDDNDDEYNDKDDDEDQQA
ncbi:hypothetical protein C2G38_2194538 [Gigaspora rosea]|uniref:Uncharacterized protein n=1 Tax=Gigaspora rosea TaxID=44941 RepID=A0A397UWX3_9GLOM|nr:hypothetical protein C2G38_2194538 [Gigaspora rosea]